MNLPYSRKLSSLVFLFVIFLALIFLPRFIFGQSDNKNNFDQKSETLKLIEKADANSYRMHRIEFSGNIMTRDRVLRKSFLRNSIGEGDIFISQKLFRALKNLNKIKNIYPVRIDDLNLILDEDDKDVDLLVVIRERKSSK